MKFVGGFVRYLRTSGFWPRVRARARPCAARTRLFGLIDMPNGALRALPAYRSFAASYLPPKTLSQARTRSARGCLYLSIGLSCTLLSYIASY